MRLSTAARVGNVQKVQELLSIGAGANTKNKALEEAAFYNHTQMIELLLSASSDIGILPEDQQLKFKHLVPIYISIQKYLMLEPFIVNISELKDRFIIDVPSNKKYVKMKF